MGTESGPRPTTVLLAVGLAGAGTMTVELAAVRLLAPWFGASSWVWTNVIGVVLLALSLGYLIGARLCTAADPSRRLAMVLMLSGALTAWLPFCAAPVAELFMPHGLALDQAADLFVWGSLAAALLLYAPAAMALGCAGPLAVEALQRVTGRSAGEVGGRVLCASTVGSLVGTFATTHALIPQVGLRWTFVGAAAVLALCGLLLAWPRPTRTELGGLLVLLLALAAQPTRSARSPEGWQVLALQESSYQHLKVVDLPAGPDAEGLRYLQVNEAVDSFQSVWSPRPGLLGPSFYYDYFVPPAHWSDPQSEWRVLVLGLGAGTAVRVLSGALPSGTELTTVGVEIDSEIIALGEEHFDLVRSAPRREVIAGLDARAAVRLVQGEFQQLIVDCYANNMEIPAHLCTQEFFREAGNRLRPGGWITVNVGGFGLADPVVLAVAQSLANGLGSEVAMARVPFSRNVMLYGRRDAPLPDPHSADFAPLGPVFSLLTPLRLPGAWATVSPAASPALTDDLNPIDRLQAQSIAAGRSRFLLP